MRNRKGPGGVAAAVCLVLGALPSAAQEADGAAGDGAAAATAPVADSFFETVRIGAKLLIGAGNEMEWVWKTEDDIVKGDSDMEASVGFALTAETPLHRYVTAGLQVGALFIETELMDAKGIDRNTFIEITLDPKVRYPLMGGDVEVFAHLPFGLSIFVPSDDYDDYFGIEAGAAWNVGLYFGVSYRVWESLAIFAELGWQGHGGSSDFTDTGIIRQPNDPGEFEYEIHQFAINFGGYFEFAP